MPRGFQGVKVPSLRDNGPGWWEGFIYIYSGHVVAQLVEALRYKPEGREFDSRWCHSDF